MKPHLRTQKHQPAAGNRSHVTIVIMAGGRGERLWPLVRTNKPKVCLSIDGKHSLLEATIDRLRGLWPDARWLIVTTNGQEDAIRDCLRHSNQRTPNLENSLLVEPQPKNTAACIGLAAIALAIRNPREIMVVMPADHWIRNVWAFRKNLRTAIRAALAHDTIVTIGIHPTYPHCGLGYLCAGTPLTTGVFRLDRFVEKPTRSVAAQLIRRPRTFWNSGIFIGAADTFLECLTEYLPNHICRLFPLANRVGRKSFVHRAQVAYRHLDNISFDHGVMDMLTRAIVVEGRFDWMDLGSWDAWAHLCRSPKTVGIESRNVTVIGEESHLVATIGVRNLIVVQSPSATLICSPKASQEVRQLLRQLAQRPQLKPYQ